MFSPVPKACLWNIETVLLLHSICGALLRLNKQLACAEWWLTHNRQIPMTSSICHWFVENLKSTPTIYFRSWFLSFSLCFKVMIAFFILRKSWMCPPLPINLSYHAWNTFWQTILCIIVLYLGTISANYTSQFTLKSNFSFQFPKFCLHVAQFNGNPLIWSLCI